MNNVLQFSGKQRPPAIEDPKPAQKSKRIVGAQRGFIIRMALAALIKELALPLTIAAAAAGIAAFLNAVNERYGNAIASVVCGFALACAIGVFRRHQNSWYESWPKRETPK